MGGTSGWAAERAAKYRSLRTCALGGRYCHCPYFLTAVRRPTKSQNPSSADSPQVRASATHSAPGDAGCASKPATAVRRPALETDPWVLAAVESFSRDPPKPTPHPVLHPLSQHPLQFPPRILGPSSPPRPASRRAPPWSESRTSLPYGLAP